MKKFKIGMFAVLISAFILTILSVLNINIKATAGNVSSIGALGIVDSNKTNDAISDEVEFSSNLVQFYVKMQCSENNADYSLEVDSEDGTLIKEINDYNFTKVTSSINSGSTPYSLSNTTFSLTISESARSAAVAGTKNFFYIIVKATSNGQEKTSKIKVNVSSDNYFDVTNVSGYGNVIKNYVSQTTDNSGKTTTNNNNIVRGNSYISSDDIPLYGGQSREYTLTINNKNDFVSVVKSKLASYYVTTYGALSQTYWDKQSYGFVSVKFTDKNTDSIVYDSQYFTTNSMGWDNITPGGLEDGEYTQSNSYSDSSGNLRKTVYNTLNDNKNETFYFDGSHQTYHKISNTDTKNPTISFSNLAPDGHYLLKDWGYSYTIADLTNPVYQGAYILNGSKSAKKGNTLQIALRFSEPVQIDDADKNKTITVTTDSNAAGTKEFDLAYSYGAGTNTLVYSVDLSTLSSNINATKITKISFGKYIKDFSYNDKFYTIENLSSNNRSKLGKLYTTTQEVDNLSLSYTIDLRTPSAQVGSVKTKIATSYTLSISLSKVTKGFTFKYKLYSKTDDNYSIDKVDFVEVTDNFKMPDSKDLSSWTANIDVGAGYNGTFYFYYELTSNYGITINNSGNEVELKIDNQKPTISNVTFTNAKTSSGDIDYNTYKVSFNINDLPFGTLNNLNNLYSIQLVYSENRLAKQTDLSYITLYNDSGVNKLSESDSTLTFTLKGSDVGISDTVDNLDLYVGLIATDICGNTLTIDDVDEHYISFDTRVKMEGSGVFSGTEVKINDNVVAYQLSNDTPITLTYTNSDTASYVNYNYTIYKYGNTTKDKTDISDASNNSKYYSVELNDKTYTFTFKNAGYYVVQFNLDNSKYSDDYDLYVVTKEDLTNNYQNVQYVVNKVYSTSSNKFYYFDSEGVKTENYNNTKSQQVFSSDSLREEYIKLYEYQDLYAIKLTSAIAQSLNSNSSMTYKKASGETTTAQAGQIWIRYKRSDWNFSENEQEWVYYYYGEYSDCTININFLQSNKNLKNAIERVVDTIVAACGDPIYLVDEGNTSSSGVSELGKDQIHIETETFTKTKCGNTLQNATFDGDKDIYSSYFTDETGAYYFFSNAKFTFGSFSKIYIKRLDGTESTYLEITSTQEGKELKEILKNSKYGKNDDGTAKDIEGKYELIELDENGMSISNIYVVGNAPDINVTFKYRDKEATPFKATEANDGESYLLQGLELNGFATKSGFFDEYSYIEVINAKNSSYTVYYYSDFETSKILTDGKYYIKVSDRFGNKYQFTVTINSSDINFTLTSSENNFVRFKCDLSDSDVFRFEVKLNGVTVSTTYASDSRYYDAGTYEFELEDIYGNVKKQSITLTRVEPVVSWYYDDGESVVSITDTDATGAILTKETNSSYYIYTNRLLQFRYSGDYSYSFVDSTIQYRESGTTTKRVQITEEGSYVVKVYYTNYTDNYVQYVVIYDKIAPSISAYVDADSYTFNDYDKLTKAPTSDKDIINDIGFKVTGDKSEFYLVDEGQIYSNAIHYSISDISTIKELIIKLNGIEFYNSALDEEFEVKSELSGTLTEYGSYEIICRDILGNENTFKFDNQEPDYYENLIDGIETTIEFSPSDAYDTVKYGHGTVLYKIEDFESFIVLIDSKYYCFFMVDDKLYLGTCVINKTDTGYEYAVESDIVYDNETAKSSYQKIELNITGIELNVKYDDYVWYLEFKVTDNQLHNIMSRLVSDYSYMPYYSNVELYAVKPEVEFDTASGVVKVNNGTGYDNETFTINQELDPNITEITYAYDETPNVLPTQKLDLTNISKYTFGDKDGYYKYKITNKYGNEAEILIVISKDLLVEITINQNDGKTFNYSYTPNTSYNTNLNAIVKIYDTTANVSIKKDGELIDITDIKTIEANYIELAIEGNGNYNVIIADENGNDRSFDLSINENDFNVDNNIIYGDNDKALKKDDLYTNVLMSIDKAKLEESKVYYISYTYKDKEYVIYDNMSQKKNIDSSLTDVIGTLGSGIYYVVFKDQWGNACIKEVHYSQTSPFVISRKTLTDDTYSEAIMDDNIVYSNYLIKFETSAVLYKLTVNGNAINCPYELQFPSSSLTGEYIYDIYYLDEFGFEITFQVKLLRQEVEYNISTETNEVNSVLTVTKTFSVGFDSKFKATYKLNNVVYNYTNDSVIYSDGLYAFTIYDQAGNTKSFSIKKDSFVDYYLKESSTQRKVINGDVSSDGKVIVVAGSGEKLTVEKAYLNGVLVESIPSTFTDNGKWELLITDEAGNKAYTKFYIYTHAISYFEYESPYNYKISKIDYTDQSGTKINYIEKVVQEVYNSKVKFNDNGSYYVEMISNATNETVSFTLTINNENPKVELVGVSNNGSTTSNVTLKGYQIGDVIRIYKDNSLTQTINVTSTDMTSPTISEKGKYRIEVTNISGNTTVLEFTRQYTANVASSVFVIVVLGAVAAALFVGLFLRKREKID